MAYISNYFNEEITRELSDNAVLVTEVCITDSSFKGEYTYALKREVTITLTLHCDDVNEKACCEYERTFDSLIKEGFDFDAKVSEKLKCKEATAVAFLRKSMSISI